MDTNNSNKVTLIAEGEIGNSQTYLFKLDLGELNNQAWPGMRALVTVKNTFFKRRGEKAEYLISKKISIKIASVEHLELYKQGLAQNLNEVSSEHNTWKIEYIEVDVNFNLENNWITIDPSTLISQFTELDFKNYSIKIGLLFLESVLHEAKKRDVKIYFCRIVDTIMFGHLCQYIDSHGLNMWFNNELRTPLPVNFEPKSCFFNDLFVTYKIFTRE